MKKTIIASLLSIAICSTAAHANMCPKASDVFVPATQYGFTGYQPKAPWVTIAGGYRTFWAACPTEGTDPVRDHCSIAFGHMKEHPNGLSTAYYNPNQSPYGGEISCTYHLYYKHGIGQSFVAIAKHIAPNPSFDAAHWQKGNTGVFCSTTTTRSDCAWTPK